MPCQYGPSPSTNNRRRASRTSFFKTSVNVSLWADGATAGQRGTTGNAWPAFEERSFEAYRSYYEYVPKGVIRMEYTVRLNNVGEFALPPSRVEAMYAPEMFGALPNARVKVEAVR